MRRMARRAGESVVDMPCVLAEARIRHDRGQIVALAAQRIRPVDR